MRIAKTKFTGASQAANDLNSFISQNEQNILDGSLVSYVLPISKINLIEKIKNSIPELPEARMKRFIEEYGIPSYDAEVLVREKALADFFEKTINIYNKPKKISNWMMGDLLRNLNENNLDLSESKITPQHLVEMIRLIEDGVITGKIGKRVLPEMVLSGKSPFQIVKEKALVRISSKTTLLEVATKVFDENPKCVKDAFEDKNAINFLVGQLMKATKGKADPQLANQIIQEKLKETKTNQKLS